MNLSPRQRQSDAGAYPVGCAVTAMSPTTSYPISGEVVECDGYYRSVETRTGLVVVVDVEDCREVAADET